MYRQNSSINDDHWEDVFSNANLSNINVGDDRKSNVYDLKSNIDVDESD